MRTTSTFDKKAFDEIMHYMSRKYAWVGRACLHLIQPAYASRLRKKVTLEGIAKAFTQEGQE